MSSDNRTLRPMALDRRSFMLTALAGTLAVSNAPAAWGQARGTPRRAGAQAGLSPTVETTAGRSGGRHDGEVFSFKGVPYAATTAGERRFQPPSPHEGWSEVRDAFELGRRCPVPQSTAQAEFVVMDRREPAGEDCLCLNVWTAGLDSEGKRPVMLWLHGGGFRGGSAGHKCYDGTRLARRHGVVVVGVNHRVNAWGYLHLAETGLEQFQNSSNVGMLDIVASLQWVQDNIERFGGDPNNVTVFGQSGGGSKVSTLLGMPAAEGLFHRAIAMSGSQVRSLTRDRAAETVTRFLTVFGLRANQADRLLEIPYYDLREAFSRDRFDWGPVVDGNTLPQHNFDPTATPLSRDVPLMIGSMETEVTWSTRQQFDPLDDATLLVFAQRALGSDTDVAKKVVSVYREGRPSASNLDLYLILASDLSNFRVGTDTEAERKSELGGAPVYKYYFDWYSPVAGGIFRAMHTMDIPFFFDDVKTSVSLIGDGAELQDMADRISSAVTAFARTGNPNGRGLMQWDTFDTDRRATMFLNANPRLVEDPYRDERLARAAATSHV
jgi:para-nitrobenzyl esterase